MSVSDLSRLAAGEWCWTAGALRLVRLPLPANACLCVTSASHRAGRYWPTTHRQLHHPGHSKPGIHDDPTLKCASSANSHLPLRSHVTGNVRVRPAATMQLDVAHSPRRLLKNKLRWLSTHADQMSMRSKSSAPAPATLPQKLCLTPSS